MIAPTPNHQCPLDITPDLLNGQLLGIGKQARPVLQPLQQQQRVPPPRPYPLDRLPEVQPSSALLPPVHVEIETIGETVVMSGILEATQDVLPRFPTRHPADLLLLRPAQTSLVLRFLRLVLGAMVLLAADTAEGAAVILGSHQVDETAMSHLSLARQRPCLEAIAYLCPPGLADRHLHPIPSLLRPILSQSLLTRQRVLQQRNAN